MVLVLVLSLKTLPAVHCLSQSDMAVTGGCGSDTS